MFNVTSFKTDATGIIYTCQWTYSNADGSVGGTHTLVAPGDSPVPVDQVTEAVITGWLEEQIQNTPAEFDVQIAADKARREAAEAVVVYTVAPDGSYTV